MFTCSMPPSESSIAGSLVDSFSASWSVVPHCGGYGCSGVYRPSDVTTVWSLSDQMLQKASLTYVLVQL